MCDENGENVEFLPFEKPYHGDVGQLRLFLQILQKQSRNAHRSQNPSQVSLARLGLANADEGMLCVVKDLCWTRLLRSALDGRCPQAVGEEWALRIGNALGVRGNLWFPQEPKPESSELSPTGLSKRRRGQ